METYSFDMQRIFWGDNPPLFLLEILFRTTLLYLYTLLLLRLLGKRGVRQLTFFEFAIILALGSAVGDPMFYDDVPLLHGALVITVIVLLQRTIVAITEKNKPLEVLFESSPRRLIKHGVLELGALAEEKLSKDEVFSRLRDAGLRHLGEVERAYLEPSGTISIWKADPETVQAGLTLMPDEDPDYPTVYNAGESVRKHSHYICQHCGRPRDHAQDDVLTICECGGKRWLEASDAANKRQPGNT
jgi:uncharacterized membrane protein YcaP (DUF421 family)